MITFPCAKINLGLNIVAERPDGYHDIRDRVLSLSPSPTPWRSNT
jgi:4-diphosphocytidyl-2C-methyl-D-erythritol kinase